MKSGLGKILREIRQGKQISICSIADEYLSKSQISRFEREESEISCARLINILDKLHISIDEFLSLNTTYTNTKNFDDLIQYIRRKYSSQNINEIMNLLSNNSGFNLNSFEKTMIKSIAHSLDSSISPTKNEIFQLTDYLFKIEKWGRYEIILLGNCARTIEYNSFFLLTKEMLNNYICSHSNKTNKKLVTQLAINCLISSIDKNKFYNCEFLITKINELLNNELYFYEKTIFLYATGYFEVKKGSSSGLKKMQQAIKVFKILEEQLLYSQYSAHYNKHITIK